MGEKRGSIGPINTSATPTDTFETEKNTTAGKRYTTDNSSDKPVLELDLSTYKTSVIDNIDAKEINNFFNDTKKLTNIFKNIDKQFANEKINFDTAFKSTKDAINDFCTKHSNAGYDLTTLIMRHEANSISEDYFKSALSQMLNDFTKILDLIKNKKSSKPNFFVRIFNLIKKAVTNFLQKIGLFKDEYTVAELPQEETATLGNNTADENALALMDALIRRDVATAKKIISKQNINLNYRDPVSHNTFLILAAKNGDLNIIDNLIAKGVDIDAINNAGCTALCVAAKGNLYNVVEKLIAAGANMNTIDKRGDTLLLATLRCGSCPAKIKTIKLLLDKGVDVITRNEYGGQTALTLAKYQKIPDDIIRNIELKQKEAANLNSDTPDGMVVLQQFPTKK